MSTQQMAILGTGLVTSVGLTAASCACAFRCGIANPVETEFIDGNGAWIRAHQVSLDPPCAGLVKLARMAALAIEEALQGMDRSEWHRLPLLLCLAEADRPGRTADLDDALMERIEDELGVSFAPSSTLVLYGRVAVAVALERARVLLRAGSAPSVLIVSTDSLLSWPTLSHYERNDRLLTELNSDGFMPGEGAGALWVGQWDGLSPQMLCTGIGFGLERGHIDSEQPLRADGLIHAIRTCLEDAGLQVHDLDLRITDDAGEQYYFKEGALALLRMLRQNMDVLDHWHPAECIGETGAVSGVAVIVAAREACIKSYAPGPRILSHWANDAGQRAAVMLEFREAT